MWMIRKWRQAFDGGEVIQHAPDGSLTDDERLTEWMAAQCQFGGGAVSHYWFSGR